MHRKTTESMLYLYTFAADFTHIKKYLLIMEKTKLGNPAVVGLAGFGLTTLLLQFHNIGLAGLGPVLSMGIVFGGFAQLIAGLMEQKSGNNFGFAAFTSYGAFWIGLGGIWLLNHFGLFISSTSDVGLYLLAWTFLTVIFWVGSMFISKAMNFTFTTLLIGFILLDLGHFGFPAMNVAAGYVLIVCALAAWYMMAAIILNDLSGRELLKVGKAILKVKE
jgi:succinate-acetate transporter protein